jgi:hypothetical protein
MQAQGRNTGTVREDLFHVRWQLAGLPADRAPLAAWPRLLPHCSLRLFHSQADAAEAHAAAPRWHMHGDYRCTSDSSVSVAVFEQGREHLRTIAQMQRELVRSRAATVMWQQSYLLTPAEDEFCIWLAGIKHALLLFQLLTCNGLAGPAT